MKKITVLTLSLIIAVMLLASCAGSDDTSSQAQPSESSSAILASSSAAESGDESSEPESSQPNESSQPESSQPDDSSEPDESSDPDESSEPDDTPEIGEIDSRFPFNRDAKSYCVVYTKNNPVATEACATHRGIAVTAQYDGSVTRFFDAISGEYYCAFPGKYLCPCCEGSFLLGDITNHNGDSAIAFEFDKDDDSFQKAVKNYDHAHGEFGMGIYFYSPSDNKTYSYSHDEDGPSLKVFTANSYVICQSFDHDYSIEDYWKEHGELVFPKNSLGKYGVVKNGKIVIPFEYDSISSYANGEAGDAGVFRAVKDGRTYYISSSGKNLTPNGFACGSEPFGKRAWVYDDEGHGCIIEFK